MVVFWIVILLFGLIDSEVDVMNLEVNYRKVICLQVKVLGIVVVFLRICKGFDFVELKEEYGIVENFLYILNGEEFFLIEVEVFNKVFIFYVDYELNVLIFMVRVCVVILFDIYLGIIVVIGVLKGLFYGGVNEVVMKMLIEIGEVENVEFYICSKMEKKEKVMGFGYCVYKYGDLCVKYLKEMSKCLMNLMGESKWYDMLICVEEIVMLEKKFLFNVDFYFVFVYYSFGIDYDLFMLIFVVSRMLGWIVYIFE